MAYIPPLNGGRVNIGAGGATASTGTVVFSNTNGVSFGMAGNTMTASVAAGGGNFSAGMSTGGNSSGNTGLAASQLVLAGGNNITLSQVTAAGGSNTLSIVGPTFTNSNNITFGANGQSITASASFNQTNQTLGLFAGGANTTQNTTATADARTLSFYGQGAASVGFSNGSVQLSVPEVPSAIVAGAATASTGTISFANSNGVNFGLNGNTLTASVAAGGVALAGGVAGTSTTITSGTANLSVGGGAMTISGSNQSLNFYVPATSSLAGANGISLSSNGSTVSIGYNGPGAGGATLSRWEYPESDFVSLSSAVAGSMSIEHIYVPFNITGGSAKIGGSMTVNTSAAAVTGSANFSLWMGIYTLTGSTLSIMSSGSAVNGFSWQGASSVSSTSLSGITGLRQLTVPMVINMTPGEYWVAAALTSGTTGVSAGYVMFGNSNIAGTGVLGIIGSATSAGRDALLGQGIYPSATSVGPNTMAISTINNTTPNNAMRAAFYHAFYNATY